MRRRDLIRRAALTPAALLCAAGRRSARAELPAPLEPVDLELVLALDVSRSIDPEEQDLQFRGYAAAFRDAGLVRQIASGPVGAIACTLFAWSGPEDQQHLVPWTRIDGPETAAAFAAAVEAQPRPVGDYTSISAAIDFAAGLFGQAFEGSRRVVDISGDGANNQVQPGRGLAAARGGALDRGIVLNGLAILDRDPPFPGPQAPRPRPLDEYYRDHVIGGPGAFLVVAEGFGAFAPAVRRKLAREIAFVPPDAPRVERVAAA
jgi:hypothetical protein